MLSKGEILTCSNPGCSNKFVKNTYHHKFCSVQCAENASHRKRRQERDKRAIGASQLNIDTREQERRWQTARRELVQETEQSVLESLGYSTKKKTIPVPDTGLSEDEKLPEVIKDLIKE